MTTYRFARDELRQADLVVLITPFGTKTVRGIDVDFDELGRVVVVPAIEEDAGMRAIRADEIYGPPGVLETIWRMVQRAAVLVVDFSQPNPNVAAEFTMALMLNKKIIVITQDPDAIPSDFRGIYRYIEYHPEDFSSMASLRKELALELAAKAQEPDSEMLLVPLPNTVAKPAPARVALVTREYVLVETDAGERSVLSNADVEYGRIISDMTRLFTVGERVAGAFQVDFEGHSKYTLLAGRTNPWPALAGEYPVGRVFTGTVKKIVANVGAFVEVAYGVSGLVPHGTLVGRGVREGDELDVVIARIDTDARRIALTVSGTVRRSRAVADVPSVGTRGWAEVVCVRGGSGYALVRLPQCPEGRAMLHVSAMSVQLAADLTSGALTLDDEIYVEVVRSEASTGRVWVKDVPPSELAEAEQTAAA